MPPKKKKKESKISKAKAAQGVTKLVVDKTFGMKNKNKSSKIKKFIQEQQNNQKQKAGLLKHGQTQDAADAERRRLKKEKAKRDKEMLQLLGPAGAKAMANAKAAKKAEKEKKRKEIEAAEAENERQRALDFMIPITTLDSAKECESKKMLPRVVAQFTFRDAMTTPQKDGSLHLYVKLEDGSTKYPMWLILKGDLAKTWGNFYKKDQVLDIRNIMAIVRSDKGLSRTVFLEQVLEKTEKFEMTEIAIATKSLTEHLLAEKKSREELRAKGGIPIEELIEEERGQLGMGGTPVTKDLFFEWLAVRKKRREKEAKDNAEKSNAVAVKGGEKKKISGRELYMSNASLFKDDESAMAEKLKGKTLSDDEEEEEDVSEDAQLAASLADVKVDVDLFAGEDL
jgi:hypothetical protein|eukprot:Stramenopile-MAST_4_protein_121